MDARETVKNTYGESGVKYDDIRLRDPKGSILSQHDVRLFENIFPPIHEQAQVLEVGAGTGRFTLPALDRGCRLIATDINETMLEELREKIRRRGDSDRCEIRIEDIFKLSFESEMFDLVFCLHVIPRFLNLKDQEEAISELTRVVKPGGRLLFNYRNSSSVYRFLHKGHTVKHSHIRQLLNNHGLRIVDLRCKHFMNRKLLNSLPIFCGRLISGIDRATERCWTSTGWDNFVLAEKKQAG